MELPSFAKASDFVRQSRLRPTMSDGTARSYTVCLKQVLCETPKGTVKLGGK